MNVGNIKLYLYLDEVCNAVQNLTQVCTEFNQ